MFHYKVKLTHQTSLGCSDWLNRRQNFSTAAVHLELGQVVRPGGPNVQDADGNLPVAGCQQESVSRINLRGR